MSRKYLTIAVIIFGVIATTLVFLYNPASPEEYAFISPLRFLPFASHNQVRATICEKANDPLFQKVCEEKFDQTAKDDAAKIDELFLILSQAQKNKKLSPYGKFLLGQLVFATLPNGTSSTVFQSRALSFAASIANAFGMKIYVQNVAISREQYEEHLVSDLVSVIKNCPKPGDENWILTAMCSEYAWVDNERQPIYSKQYVETGGPNWCNEQGEAGATQVYHAQSIINIKMRSEYNFSDSPNLSNQIACMFSCGSYPSVPVAGETSGQKCEPAAEFDDFTEAGYSGEDLLRKILDKARNVQMPSQPDADSLKDIQVKQQCVNANDGTLRECPQIGQPCRADEVVSQRIRMCVSDSSFINIHCIYDPKKHGQYVGRHFWEVVGEEAGCSSIRNACQNGYCVE